ncbi:MAG: hypothetical protein RLZZ258_406 [Actinomycetota bacterium]
MFLKKIAQFIAPIFIAASLVGLAAAPAHAVTLDANNVTLDFTDSKKSNIIGTNGTAAGDIVKYNAVAAINGTTIDAVVENLELLGMSNLDSFDVTGSGFDSNSSAQDLFQLSFNNVPNSGGFVRFRFSFYEQGTYSGPGTGIPVTLQNVRLNAYDIDAGQYVEFSGFQQYKYAITNNPDRFAPSVVSGSSPVRTKFAWASSASYDTNNSAGSNSYDAGRMELKYAQVTTLEALIGDANGGGAVYGLEWGIGPAWPDGTTDAAFVNNTNNTPPSSTDTTLYTPVNDSITLSVRDFGNYSDPQGDGMAGVTITSLPTVGTLEKFVNNAWVAVVANDFISKADIESGKLRFTRAAGDTANTSLQFKVNDGLANSANANTLTLNAATSNQTLTFVQPSNQQAGDPAFNGQASSTSGLQVMLTSNSPSVCTVDNTVNPSTITPVGAGICSVTATEPGSASYATAQSITRTFTVTGSNYLVSFNKWDPAATGSNPASVNGVVITMPTQGSMALTGKVLSGWTTDSVRSSAFITHNIGSAVRVSAATTFYAVWANATAQAITFTQPADTTTATTTVTLAPTADSNLTVVLTSSTPSVCTVSGFVVTILSAGTCTLAANQPGNSTYAAATQVTRSFQVTAPQSNSNNNSTPTPVVTPTPTPTPSPTTSATPVAQSTNNKKPVELKLPEVPQGGTACLLETNDTDCSTGKVVVPGQGTWTVGANNQVKFTPEPGFVGTARATFKIASLGSITLFPLSVKVTKRPPVTTTIGNFIDGSPVITAEIGKRIAAFIKKYSDYRTIECIGFTEGPTVLKTDKALSLARATNACGYVKKTLKKSFVQVPLKAKQDTVENNQRRRITITLRD